MVVMTQSGRLGVMTARVLSLVVMIAPGIHWVEEKCCSSRSAQVMELRQGTLLREWKVSY